MDDLISRQQAIDAIMGEYPDAHYPDWYASKIRALPSAQKKGHWIDEGTNYSCSECHRGCWVNSNYCPWCGADMRGEQDEIN